MSTNPHATGKERSTSPLYDQPRLSRKPSTYRQPDTSSHGQHHPPADAPTFPNNMSHNLSQARKQRPYPTGGGGGGGATSNSNDDTGRLSRKPSYHHSQHHVGSADINTFAQHHQNHHHHSHGTADIAVPQQARKQRNVSSLYDPTKLSRKPSYRVAPNSPSSSAGSGESISRKNSIRTSSNAHADDVATAALGRRPSTHRAPTPTSAELDDATLKRTLSHRVHPTFANKSIRHHRAGLKVEDEAIVLPTPPTPRPSSSVANAIGVAPHTDDDSEAAKLRRFSSMKSGRRRLTDQEREERRRIRNRENSRRIRERQREEQRNMERIYDVNEARIKELEKVVDELSSELGRSNTISRVGGGSRPDTDKSKKDYSAAFKVPEERPGWFGDSF